MELFYRHYGEGSPLIILHGVFGLSDNWVSFARQISGDFEVYIPDQRNHGHSPHHPVINYYALCSDLSEFIDKHQISKPVILGHSMGGKVAMRFALENPGIPRALIIADISMRTYQHRYQHLEMIDAILSVDLDHAPDRETVAIELRQKLKDERIIQFVLKNLYRREKGSHFAWRPNLEAINMHMDDLFEGVQSKNIFNNPALFIRGENSDYVSYEDFDQIYRNFPKADIKTIEGAGHWLHAEKPETFNRMVVDFLRGIDL